VGEILAGDPVDVVHVEGFYLMQHVPGWSPAPVVLAEQNVEYDLERQRAGAVEVDDRLAVLAACLDIRRAEVETWQRAARLVAVTPEDRDMIGDAAPGAQVQVVPDGADHLAARSEDPTATSVARPSEPLLALVANFAYAPNVDAAVYLVEVILAQIRARVPDAHLWLVGNDPPPEVRALAGDRIRVTGRVPDVVGYLDAADVVLCPLRIGGGIKVKAIEALRRGKASVTTAVGAQGLPSAARAAIRVANDPAAFAAAAADLLIDGDRRRELERRAMRAAAELPTWDEAAAGLAGIYDELVAATAAQWRELMTAGGLT
jgi:glycosyltransferase involved in cell wall biosynthesis